MGLRLGLVSDLHGNLVALDAALTELERRGAERILCLGDVVDLGPQPQQVVERLMERGIETVLGNHDPLDEPTPIPELADIAAWSMTALDDRARGWLAGLPHQLELELDGVRVLAVHGSPRACTDQILAETDPQTLRTWWADTDFDLMVFGHTHVQLDRVVAGRRVVGVGSTGMPFVAPFLGAGEPTVVPRIDFALVTCVQGEAQVELLQLPLDVTAYLKSVAASGMPHQHWWARHWS